MSRHRSPGGPHAHPWLHPQPATPPGARRTGARHTAASTAVRHGLTAAAVTGGALALTAPILPAVAAPVAPQLPTTLTLATEAQPGETDPERPSRVQVVASLVPVAQPVEPADPAVDAAELLKAVGLADLARAAEEERASREAAARCDADLGGLGRVRPWVRDAAQFFACLYDQPDLIGVARRGGTSDHPAGLAVDLLVDRERGDRLAECALQNKAALGVAYVIWRQRVNHGDGWEPMSDRGGVTANHFDHVHISFEPDAPGAAPVAALCR